ncbi:endonuclease/exonuclease/phosphatase family protein [Nocardioides KLBMP 9356]|uniref:Endonuclease/exonuclease/phosphatase family protein n=1 Tax=Nocardioides potassii TaxID=2911371 RepID=A0ABS9HFU9_9ACTN|nr:endonuclease/exonuclease/phosphatase family protein [Nocardioides potassii]MCF6380010.1 endonuclease/exonuclease/phosphatase family protein [Nocardioides potassii]
MRTTVRIGTWNLEGRWTERHATFVDALDCDVLLLTEVSERVDLPRYDVHLGEVMSPRRRWAAVASRTGLSSTGVPHGASASAVTAGLQVCSSVLPWRGCGGAAPWEGTNTAARTAHATAAVAVARPDIWGGDWNHSLSGQEWAGSKAGRALILATVADLGLQVPTESLPHRLDGVLSIDHIAVPDDWEVSSATRVDATGLSDHDAYVVETTPVPPGPAS